AAQVLRLGVEVTAIAVERVLAEDRGDLERIGELVGALAPAHGVVEQAGDVEALVSDAGTVHLQQHDAGGVAADRSPDWKAERMRRHGDLLDRRAQLRKALRGIAHMRIDVGLRIGMTETLLDDRDAHSSGAAVERLGVAACRYATLARVETVG